ncbi:MAG: hypothetical protein K1W10_11070 [Lachnospiraceae bacterium]
MDVEREEYHFRDSREEPSPAENGSCKENGKVRPGVRRIARLTPLSVKRERVPTGIL